jgi:hypothetical protein
MCLDEIVVNANLNSLLATPPKENVTKRYSTRTNSQCIVDLVPKPGFYYKRKRYRHKTRELNDQLRLEFVKDIRRLFVDNLVVLNLNQMISPWLIDCYKPFDFFNTAGYPHDFPSSLEKISLFQSDNAIGVNEHWDDFMDFVRAISIEHFDVFYKCFALSLEKDARKWFLMLILKTLLRS